MSLEVVTGPLLDFGKSYWHSDLMKLERPTLAETAEFRPRGRDGYGFLSILLWGSRAQVITRRSEAPSEETLVVEIDLHEQLQPKIRIASPAERLVDGGTLVRVWIDAGLDNVTHDVIKDDREVRCLTNLRDLCLWLCPALDVSLSVTQLNEQTKTIVIANDWLVLSAKKLLRRVWVGRGYLEPFSDTLEFLAAGLNLIVSDEGQVLGRAVVAPSPRSDNQDGVICEDGFRAMDAPHIAGVLLGRDAARIRDLGNSLMPADAVARWLTKQAPRLNRKLWRSLPGHALIANTIWLGGGNLGPLIIARGITGLMSQKDVELWAVSFDEVLLTSYRPNYGEASIYRFEADFSPNENTLLIFSVFLREAEKSIKEFARLYGGRCLDEGNNLRRPDETLFGAVIQSLACSWCADERELLSNATEGIFPVGKLDGMECRRNATLVRRPPH